MFGVVWAAAVVLAGAGAAASLGGEGFVPAGTFSCSILAAEKYDGGDGELMSSVIGDITLDGNGGYTQIEGSGLVVLKPDGALHFTSGGLSGTVAVIAQDSKGQQFLHIDSTVMNVPAGAPKFGDHICLKK